MSVFQDNRTLKEFILAGNEFEENAGSEFGSAIGINKHVWFGFSME